MSTAKKTRTPRAREMTTFTCHAPNAERVCVAGDFNEWDPDAIPMKKDQDSEWTAKVDLPTGRHEYRFIVDGEWCCDPWGNGAYTAGGERVRNAYGTMNHVIEVA